MFNIVPKNKNPSYRGSIKIELNLHCFGERLSSFIFEVKNILEILEIRSFTKKRNYLRVCSFWNSISVDFSSEQKCSSWQKLIICVVFRTTSAFLAELSMHACTATRHFIQLWGERVKVGRLIKARVFELGIAPTPLMGQRWFLKQPVKPIPITVWWTRDKAAYMLSQALSAIYYFYLFTNKHKNLLLTYLSFFLKRYFFKKILKITSLKRYHRIITFKEIHKSKYNSLKKAY